MLIAWTTVGSREVAEDIAAAAIAENVAVCVQVEGPVSAHYRWQGEQERAEEWRLMFKFLARQSGALEKWVHGRHPYETPEWVVVRAEHISEKYLSWARGDGSLPRS